MLIDSFMPSWDVIERHDIEIERDAQTVYRVARSIDFLRSKPIALLFAIRGIPHLLTGKVRPSRSFTLDQAMDAGFVLLQEEPGVEIVLGAVGRFWRLDSGIERIAADSFRDFQTPGYAKATLNLRVEPAGEQRSRVVTETRVRCTDEGARRRFLLYWRAIGPFSALTRRLLLRMIKESAVRA